MLTKIAAFAILLGTLEAHAADRVHCDVLTIEASNTNRGIDPKLAAFAEVFKQAPFSGFNTFKLVHRKTYEMPTQVPVSLTLPSALGGTLKLDRLEGSKLDLTLTLSRQGKKPIQIRGRASPGTPFFAAGLKHPTGVWIFGVACARSELIVH